MNITKTDIEGLLIIEPKIFADDRGFFMETYNKQVYETLGISSAFVQDNLSLSKKGTVRGLHFQNDPHAQGKLVSVLKGKVLDVAVDVRPESPTFGKHFTIELSEENKKQFFVPAGFAHGFMALADDTIFVYKCTDTYSKECEEGIIYNDSTLAIQWPEGEKIISEKDMILQTFESFKEKRGL